MSLVKRRLIESSAAIEEDGPESIAFQHTVFCQACLPYQDPGSEVRLWQREQGAVSLRVEAGDAKNPKTGEWVKLGLPFGSKPRLILAHLNAEALRQGSPAVNVGDSLTGFVKRIRKFKGGREVRMFKDQLGRLSASLIRLAYTRDGRGTQIDTKIVAGFDLWFPRDERPRVLWPSIVRLSLDYFESLQKHAVPLDERALGASRTPRCRVQGHWVLFGLHARIGHELLVRFVTHLPRWPDDPGEDDRLVVLALDGYRERCQFALGDIVAPALDDLQRTVLLEDGGRIFGVLLEFLAVCRRHCCDESIDVAHGIPPLLGG